MQKQQQTKTNLIRFRVTPDEKKNIQQAAAKAGQQLSTYARRLLQEGKDVN